MTRGLIFGSPRLTVENYSIFLTAQGSRRKYLKLQKKCSFTVVA
jgi:hypothetical protein